MCKIGSLHMCGARPYVDLIKVRITNTERYNFILNRLEIGKHLLGKPNT